MILFYAKLFFFQVVAPMIILAGYAVLVPKAVTGLVKAVKTKRKGEIWGYSWALLAFLYFFIMMVKRCD